jgi:4-amino-4-deoxy-L-arabinose transferase-like glycosyltransferase
MATADHTPGPSAATAPPRAVEAAPAAGGRGEAAIAAGSPGGGVPARWIVPAALGLVLALALALRLWGIRQGLPYAFNSDEDAHFVPHAIGMLTLGWNPHYFANPPAFTYLLRFVFTVLFGGRAGVDHTFATNPAAVFTAARVTAALLGTLAVWLLYLAGARLFDRGVALLAAALEAVAFLPVFYAHLALNDVPTLAPLTLSLLGTANVLRRGRARDYLIAGIGLGLGCATKYTAGIALAPLLAAAAAQYLAPSARRASSAVPAAVGLALAAGAALVAFLIADPYSVLDLHAFEQGIAHQSSLSGETQGKLGAPHESGIVYYLWSLTWGLGWIPALAALGGAIAIWWRGRSRETLASGEHPHSGQQLGWVLVPAPLLYLAFMGTQGRYFGRWVLPIFPILCLLAAYFALRVAKALARRVPRLRAVVIALAALALCAQGVIYSVHSGLVLSRADTRNLTRAWMKAHIPAGTPIVVEPVVPDEWVQDVGHPTLTTPDGDRWPKYQSLRSVINAAGAVRPDEPHEVGLEDYELTLGPALIPYYEREGYCWVVSGYAESGRAFADPARAPLAVAYYRALARQGEVVYHVSPYSPGARPVAFNFDWTFDYYPLGYERPGPEMTIYRLRGGRCARG